MNDTELLDALARFIAEDGVLVIWDFDRFDGLTAAMARSAGLAVGISGRSLRQTLEVLGQSKAEEKLGKRE